jgi:sec-independent protein translocase protein TatB
MFDIGWSELLVIVVVAIVVVGPKELPRLLRTFGHYAGKLRRAASDFQRQFEEAMRESEVDEVKKAIESVRRETPSLDQTLMLPKEDAGPKNFRTFGPGSPIEAPEPLKPAKPKRAAAKPKGAPVKSAGKKAASAKPRKAKPEPNP